MSVSAKIDILVALNIILSVSVLDCPCFRRCYGLILPRCCDRLIRCYDRRHYCARLSRYYGFHRCCGPLNHCCDFHRCGSVLLRHCFYSTLSGSIRAPSIGISELIWCVSYCARVPSAIPILS